MKVSGDNFFKRVGSSKGKKASQTNFYIPSNKSSSFQIMIESLKSDLTKIQEMINSNTNEIKMYKLLSKVPGLTKKLSDIEESKNISIFIDKITEQSSNIEKIYQIYGTKSANECIQKLFLECGLNDLLIKKVDDYFILMKLKINNDDSYEETFSKVNSIKEFMNKVPIENINKNINQSKKDEEDEINCKNEIEEFLKLNTLNELLEINVNNKKICPHVKKLVDNYFINLNNGIINILNKYESGKDNLNNINDFTGNQIQKYYKLKEICENVLIDYDNKIEDLLNKQKETPNLNDEIEKINLKYENQKKELNTKIEELSKENEDLKNKINSNSEFKYTIDDINKIKNNLEEEKNKIEDKYKLEINSLNNNIKNLKDHLKDLEEKEKELNENKKETILITTTNKPIIEKIDVDEFIKRNDKDYSKRQKEANDNLDNEIKELTIKIDKLTYDLNILKMEKSDIKRKLDAKQSKTFDEDSYEQVLLQQFETMKEAFIKKIHDLTIQVNQVQCDTKKRTFQLEDDLKESEHLKSVFLEQIVNLQRQLGI